MNFPKFSESKGILKIGRSEVCVSGGSSRVGLLNQEYVYINVIPDTKISYFDILTYQVYFSCAYRKSYDI